MHRILIRGLKSCALRQASSPIVMPALSPTMTEGTITEWLVKPGDKVNEGDELCLVETDKAVVTFETMEEGIVSKIFKPEGSSNIKVGDCIAFMVDEGDDWENAEFTPPESNGQANKSDKVAPPPVVEPTPTKTSEVHSSAHRKTDITFPSVKLLALQHGVDLTKVPSTGPLGILTKGDVLNYIKNTPTSAPVATEAPTPVSKAAVSEPKTPKVDVASVQSVAYNDVEITQMRKIIATRLTESKTTIPHEYAKISCRLDNIMKLRADLKTQGVKVSVNDFIVKAVASALRKHPNISNEPGNCDVSVAVATDAGLITPIVKNADSMGVGKISATVKELAGRAREKKLKPEEFIGGNFTISNLGMFGIREFSAVINPPQYCILAIGGSKKKFLPNENNDLEVGTMMTVQMSSDARHVSQTDAIQFLETFKENMSNPINMLL